MSSRSGSINTMPLIELSNICDRILGINPGSFSTTKVILFSWILTTDDRSTCCVAGSFSQTLQIPYSTFGAFLDDNADQLLKRAHDHLNLGQFESENQLCRLARVHILQFVHASKRIRYSGKSQPFVRLVYINFKAGFRSAPLINTYLPGYRSQLDGSVSYALKLNNFGGPFGVILE